MKREAAISFVIKSIVYTVIIILFVLLAVRMVKKNNLLKFGNDPSVSTPGNINEADKSCEEDQRDITALPDVFTLDEAISAPIVVGFNQVLCDDGNVISVVPDYQPKDGERVYGDGFVEYQLRSVDYINTLPNGMYISDGSVYKSSGEVFGNVYTDGQDLSTLSDYITDGSKVKDGYTIVYVTVDGKRLEVGASADEVNNVSIPIGYLAIFEDIPYADGRINDNGDIILWSSTAPAVAVPIGETVSFEGIFVISNESLADDCSLYLCIRMANTSRWHDSFSPNLQRYVKLT